MATFVLVHGAWHGGWRYRELLTGHDAMVTMPRELSGLLLEAAS